MAGVELSGDPAATAADGCARALAAASRAARNFSDGRSRRAAARAGVVGRFRMGPQSLRAPHHHLSVLSLFRAGRRRRRREGAGAVGDHCCGRRLDRRCAGAISRRYCGQRRTPEALDRALHDHHGSGDADDVVREATLHRMDARRRWRERRDRQRLLRILRRLSQRASADHRAAETCCGIVGPRPRARQCGRHRPHAVHVRRLCVARPRALEFRPCASAVWHRPGRARAGTVVRSHRRHLASHIQPAALSVHAGSRRNEGPAWGSGNRGRQKRDRDGQKPQALSQCRRLSRRPAVLQRRHDGGSDLRRHLCGERRFTGARSRC